MGGATTGAPVVSAHTLLHATIVACLPTYFAHHPDCDRRWTVDLDSPLVHIALAGWVVAERWHRERGTEREATAVELFVKLTGQFDEFHLVVHNFVREEITPYSLAIRLHGDLGNRSLWYHLPEDVDLSKELEDLDIDSGGVRRFTEEAVAIYEGFCKNRSALDEARSARTNYRRS